MKINDLSSNQILAKPKQTMRRQRVKDREIDLCQAQFLRLAHENHS